MPKAKALEVHNKLAQESVIDFLSGVDWASSSKAPFVVEFDPTSNCNLACPDCISGSLLNQGEIESSQVRRVVQEMIDCGVRAVILIGGGEPMMHRDTGWILNTLGEAGVKIGITTNGLYLKQHLDSLSKYVDWVRVSMDAGTPETFGRLRPSKTGKSLFNLAVENMRRYAAVKRGRLGYSFMIFERGDFGFSADNSEARAIVEDRYRHITTNVFEIYTAAKLAKDIGCDYFEVKPMYDVNHFTVMQREEIARVVDEQILLAKSLESDTFQVFEALKLRASLRGDSNLEPKQYTRCAVAQMRTLVTSSGVYVCPYFRGVDHKKIGDVNSTGFKEMWHGETRQRVMSKLNPSVDCPMHCIRNESNLTIESWIEQGFPDTGVRDYDLFV
jgi:MoaA/NifB/PqqE/SkfB family radical SAM enzyme